MKSGVDRSPALTPPTASHAHSTRTLAHGQEPPSAWVQRWAPLLAPGSRVLDVACGHGRHMAYLASLGHQPLGIDRNPEALASAAAHGQVLQADIENAAWPLSATFDALVVTHYLWRPLWPQLRASVRPGGLVIYETFSQDHARFGKPSRPDFLLAPGELLNVFAGWRVVAYEEGFLNSPARCMQRIVAIQTPETQGPYAL